MKLVETAIHRPVSTAVGVLLLILFGLIALFRIPIQLTPEVVHPQISVTTTWFGASPEEIEREVVEKQEEQLKSLDGLVKMKSESLDSEGTITLEFEIDTDMNAALLEVANRLNQIADYPDNVDQPVILAMGETSETVAWMILKTKPGNDRDIETYYEFVEDFIQARLERIPGVAKSYIYGGRPRELQVILDPDRLAARNVTIREVIDALRRENVNRSGGDFDEGKRRYIVRTVGAFRTPEDVAGIVVQQRGTTAVHLRDVAEVRLGHRKRREVVRQKGEPALAINCLRKSGANVLTVMKGIHEAIAELNAGVLAEQGLYLEQVYDATKYIESAIGLVRQNIYVGGALAVAVLFLFLRSASSILVIALAIPISIVGTFLLMALFGRNINVISLAGMSFAVGMVVDNAIVVLENIFRHRQMGKGRLEAAYRGTVEVWGAVLASTLTTMTVFLPVIFVKEEAGQLFRDIAIAISCAVALSLLVSITVIPSTSARILGGGVQRGPRRGIGRLGGAFTRLTADFVYAVCRRTSTRLALILLLTLASVGMVYLLKPEAEYLPEGNRNLIFGILL
ncbi:MAG: efflux RND transporter permease subunit, partial [Deltaproteobacteria bacterium]